MMDHNSIRHKLSEYIDGAVSAAEKVEIETHLKTCEKCGDALTELKKTIEHVRSIDEIEPPAWMTQKIMAKVRGEAEQQKSYLERLYSAFVVKLPVKAVAVVFLTAIAFYMYRGIRPQNLSETTPMEEMTARQQASPAPAAKDERFKPGSSSPRSKQVPQAPGYKALDMKGEYEKPAPPVLADKMAPAPAKPAEQPMLAKKEARALAPQAAAPVMAENQAAPAAGTSATAEEGFAAAPRMLKSKMAAATKPDKILLTLSVQDITDAVQRVEALLARIGNKVIRKEAVANTNVLTIKLNSADIRKFTDQLRELGTLKGKDIDTTRLSETVTIELSVVNPLPQSH
jgi:hypothetical protein